MSTARTGENGGVVSVDAWGWSPAGWFHAVMASLVVLHLRPLVGGPARLVLLVWWGFLLCSTLATGQHRLLDLMTGTMLALAVHLGLERRPVTLPSRP